MLGKRLINTGGAGACTTDTVQIFDPSQTQSTSLYRFEDNADSDIGIGKFGGAAKFQSSGSYATIPSWGQSQSSDADYSLSFWIKFESLPTTGSGYVDIIQDSSGAGPIQLYIYGVSGGGHSISLQRYLGVYYYNSGYNSTAAKYNNFQTGQWYHIAISYVASGKNVSVYINGTQSGITNSTYSLDTATGNYSAGSTDVNVRNQRGFLDQFRVFNKAISSSEVTTLYNETTSTASTLQVLGDTSCIATYTFDGNSNDLSTNYNATSVTNVIYDYNGTASNVTYTTGKFGKAIEFNGSTGFVNVENMSTVLANDFTVSMWVKTPSSLPTSGYPTFISLYGYLGSGSAYGWSVEIWGAGASSRFMFYWVSASHQGNSIQSGPISADTWYHVLVKKNSSSASLYINGQLDHSGGTSISSYAMYYSGITDLTFGAKRLIDGGSISSQFTGLVDQVRLFTTQLGPGEINSLYNETATSAASATIDNPSTVAYYKMADASDETGSYDATTVSNVNFNVQGKYGFAGNFNGSSSQIITGYAPQAGTTATTISLWINFNSYANSYGVIVGDNVSGTTTNGFLTLATGAPGNGSSGHLWVSLGDQSGGYDINTSQSFDSYGGIGSWIHVVVTVSGTSVSIYMNGTLATSYTSSVSYAPTASAHNYRFGYINGWGYLDARLDQVRFFNKAISASEVNNLYNEIQCANIDTPESYFNTKLYTGDGNARSITGIGFDPDFVWIKKRANDTKDHRLFDTVRGANKVIYSSRDLGEATPTDELTAFVTDGFSLGNASAVNDAASDTYVSWNWKAGMTNKSVSFSGAGSNIATTLANSNFTSNYSISFWVNLDNANTFQNFTGNYKSSGGYGGFTFMSRDVSGTYRYGFIWWTGSGSNYNYVDNLDVVATSGVWAHLVATKASGALPKLYVNGTASSLNYLNSDIDHGTTSENFTIGNTLNTNYSAGLIDQVRVFNKEISAAEVTTLYNETSSTINTLQVLGDTSCIAAYPLGINANDLDTSTPQNGTASNVVFDNPGHLTRNNNGTIESTVSASQESGFSIVKATFNTSSPQKIGHGLTSVPEFIISKRTSTTSDWNCYHKFIDATAPEDYLIKLNSPDARSNNSIYWNDTAPTSSVFTTGSIYDQNETVIFYCFHSVDGYQKIGSFIGTGTPENFIYTGFEPAWVLIKNITTGSTNWVIVDNKRDNADEWLYANANSIAYDDSNTYTKFYANGFSVANNGSYVNTSGDSYIFLAVAANPDTTAPTKANSFKTVLYNSTGSSQAITGTGFKPDLTWIKNRANGVTNSWHTITDSVRGGGTRVFPNSTSQQYADNYDVLSFQDNGFTIGGGTYVSWGSGSYVSWSWKGSDHDRNLATINYDGSATSLVSANPAAGFSVVKWTGTGVDGTKIGHGLQGSPEMIITKGLSNATSWVIGVGNISGLSINDYFTFTGYAKANSSTFYQAYSTNTFQVGVSAANEMNKNSSNQYISYCFRTIAGHSKVGKYTGTGVSGLEIALDFSPSFLLVKGAGATGWIIIDNQRPTPGGNYELYPHLTNTEDTSATSYLLGTNKFTVNSTGTWHNVLNTDYIYLAIK